MEKAPRWFYMLTLQWGGYENISSPWDVLLKRSSDNFKYLLSNKITFTINLPLFNNNGLYLAYALMRSKGSILGFYLRL